MQSFERITLFWQKQSLLLQSFLAALAKEISFPVSPAVFSIATMTSTGGDRAEQGFCCLSVKASNISRVGVISLTGNCYSIETCEEQRDNVCVLEILNCNFLKRHMRKKD